MDAFATAISYALQYGVPLKFFVDKFSHVRFEPSGWTGNPTVPYAKSIMDYIFRWMGARFIGEKGTLNATMLEYVFTPADGGAREGRHMLSKTGNLENVDFSQDGSAYLETENRHVQDFMRARETRGRPVADIEEGHISSASCELANLSLQLGRALAYDPKTRTVPGDAEATRLLARPYRTPWVHPDPATV